MKSLIIVAVLTICGDPLEVVGYLPDKGEVHYINVGNDPLHAIALKMIKSHPSNVIELTRQVPAVCS